MRFIEWLNSWFTATRKERDKRLVIDDSGVTCERPNGVFESVTWDDLQKVTIMTTDDGPFGDDVFFVLYASDSGCVVPQSAPQSSALLERLQQLPGFDNDAVIQAMGCASNNEFPCWSRTTDLDEQQ